MTRCELLEPEWMGVLKRKKESGMTFMDLEIETGVHKSILSMLLKYPNHIRLSKKNHHGIKDYCERIIDATK